jgi:site-specific DNA-methyltransferase (adenine-specific)
MNDLTKVFNTDCLPAMKEFPDRYFDLVVTDPPYGLTQNKWDTVINLAEMWEQLERITKDNGAFIFTSQQPFTTDLINSNRKIFRYDLIWEKSIGTGFLNANRMPLRGHEVVCIFYKKLPTYNPVKHKLITPSFKKRSKTNSTVSPNYGNYRNDLDKGDKEGNRHPRSVFTIDYEDSFFDSSDYNGQDRMIHPTQKPVSLFRYLIMMYSNPGDMVLDCFMGSQSSRIAAFDEHRQYVGYELDKDYFEAGCKRFEQHKSQLKLFNP